MNFEEIKAFANNKILKGKSLEKMIKYHDELLAYKKLLKGTDRIRIYTTNPIRNDNLECSADGISNNNLYDSNTSDILKELNRLYFEKQIKLMIDYIDNIIKKIEDRIKEITLM